MGQESGCDLAGFQVSVGAVVSPDGSAGGGSAFVLMCGSWQTSVPHGLLDKRPQLLLMGFSIGQLLTW